MKTLQLLDETSSPELRKVIGRLLKESGTVDMAIGRIRLANLDLTEKEIAGPRQCRVLLGHLDASMLLDAGAARSGAVTRLAHWTRSGRLEVRSAGIGAWTPDFSIYHGAAGVCLIGAHYFGSPQLIMGPSFTIASRDADVRARLQTRFNGLWERSHDVLPAIARVLENVGVGAATP